MPWVRIDERFPEHPKWGNASAQAVQWFLFALCYCNRNLTDGFIPMGVAYRLIHTKDEDEAGRVLGELMEMGVILAEARQKVRGYRMHDFLNYQPSKRAVEQARRASKRRKGAWIERKKNGSGTDMERERNGVPNGDGTAAERVENVATRNRNRSLEEQELDPVA